MLLLQTLDCCLYYGTLLSTHAAWKLHLHRSITDVAASSAVFQPPGLPIFMAGNTLCDYLFVSLFVGSLGRKPYERPVAAAHANWQRAGAKAH